MFSAIEECREISPILVSLRPELSEAIRDFYYLLERGYNRRLVLDIVTSRYRLSRVERLLLYRSVFPSAVNDLRRRKLVKEDTLQKYSKLIVDGFNQISTVASALVGDVLVVSTDGLVRDLAATNRRVTFCPLYVSSLYLLLRFAGMLFRGELLVVLDSQISWSKHFANTLRELCDILSLKCTVLLSNKADKTIIEQAQAGIPVASSDSVVADRVDMLFDLAGTLGKIISPTSVLEITVAHEETKPARAAQDT